jgi:ribose transport system ATP-binding protein
LRNKNDKIGEVALSVNNLTSSEVTDVSFELHRGEVLGIAGLVGAGRTEMARLILGADPKLNGTVELNEKSLKGLSPTRAMMSGIGMLPESRKEEGLVLSRSMSENIAYSLVQKSSKFGIVPWRKINQQSNRMIQALNIRPNNPNIQVMFMSGGNQQKVVLSKLLAAQCDVLILDEPTRGVDVGARLEIYKLMMEMKSEGKAILMISSDLPEILTQADRILVMSKGKIVGELMAEEATEEKVLKLALQLDGGDQ